MLAVAPSSTKNRQNPARNGANLRSARPRVAAASPDGAARSLSLARPGERAGLTVGWFRSTNWRRGSPGTGGGGVTSANGKYTGARRLQHGTEMNPIRPAGKASNANRRTSLPDGQADPDLNNYYMVQL